MKMTKLSQNETNKEIIKLKPLIVRKLMELEVGESFVIEDYDKKYKTPLPTYIGGSVRRTKELHGRKYTTRTQKDGKYLIMRIN